MKFTNFSQEEILPFLFESTIADLKEGVPELSSSQLTTCISYLQTQDHFDSVQRLIAIIDSTSDTSRLESIGKGVSLKQFCEILSAIADHRLPIQKLSPILVGLAPLIFQQALHKVDEDQLAILKQDSMTEPLQHQLTLFVHAFERLYQDLEVFISELSLKIHSLTSEELTSEILEQLDCRILDLKKSSEEHLNAINKALAIIWTTNRLDLITNFNQLKERFFHQLGHQIGNAKSEQEPTSGLFKDLQESLDRIFSSPSSIDLLDDEDAAIEGLAKFSIWYLPDYWSVGLLPTITDPEKLEMDPNKHEEKERFEYRQYLLGLVEWNLVRLGIEKIADLKKHKIYSKHMLKTYIAQNQECLNDT